MRDPLLAWYVFCAIMVAAVLGSVPIAALTMVITCWISPDSLADCHR